MKKIIFIMIFSFSLFANDIIIKESGCDVHTTVHHLKRILHEKNLQIFAIINHGANAKAAGFAMPPAVMVVFGKAQMGTQLMRQDPTVGLDLPLRILVYETKEGTTKIAYRDGSWLARHHLLDAAKIIEKMDAALEKITTKAGQCKND